jgi:hypothetical protein
MYVTLLLNKRLAAAVKAWSGVIAADVADGKVGPPEYYSIESEDDDEAEKAYISAMLAARLRQVMRAAR